MFAYQQLNNYSLCSYIEMFGMYIHHIGCYFSYYSVLLINENISEIKYAF